MKINLLNNRKLRRVLYFSFLTCALLATSGTKAQNSVTKNHLSTLLMQGVNVKSHGESREISDSLGVINGNADFNADGKDDFLFYNTDSRIMTVWLMDGSNVVKTAKLPGLGSGWEPYALEDFNGDGKTDLLLYNELRSQVAIWLINGTSLMSFGPAYTMKSGWKPHLQGDVNGDGKTDLLLYHHENQTMSVWLGNNKYLETSDFSISLQNGWKPQDIGDFDGDGKDDILAHHSGNSQFSILLMNSNNLSQVGEPINLNIGFTVRDVADYNADGKQDILVSNLYGGELSILLMDATNVVQESDELFNVGSDWSFLNTGDFDADSKSDILLYNETSSQLTVWLTDGVDIKLKGPAIGINKENINVMVGDLNGDLSSDVIFISKPAELLCSDSQDDNSGEKQISTLLMDGVGINVNGQPHAFDENYGKYQVTANFDGDEQEDDMLFYNEQTRIMSIWLMDGKNIRTKGALTQLGSGWAPHIFGDFNSDGRDDVLLYHKSTNRIAIWLISGTGVIGYGPAYTIPIGWKQVMLGDFNNDKKADVLLHNEETKQLWIWSGNGKGFIVGQTFIPLEKGWMPVALGEFDSDNNDDILLLNTADSEFMIWEMSGEMVKHKSQKHQLPTDMQLQSLTDFDGDGRDDILLSNAYATKMSIWIMHGSDTVADKGLLPELSKGWAFADTGDFDADSQTDIFLYNNSSSQIMVWLIDDTSLKFKGKALEIESTKMPISVGDLDGDLKSDIILFGETYIPLCTCSLNAPREESSFSVNLMNGSDIKLNGENQDFSEQMGNVFSKGDFDGDGIEDVLFYNPYSHEITIRKMNGVNVHSEGKLPNLIAGWGPRAIGDFNADGKDDILLYNKEQSRLAVWLIDGFDILDGGFGNDYPLGEGWDIHKLADFSNDGKADILLYNESIGQLAVWQMEGNIIAKHNPTPYGLAAGWTLNNTGDFNADGREDILLYNELSSQFAIWGMSGVYISIAGAANTISDKVSPVAINDFNGDGKDDIAFLNSDNSEISIWLMNGVNSVLSKGTPIGINEGWSLYHSGYFTNDLNADLMFYNEQLSKFVVWTMSGVSVQQYGTINDIDIGETPVLVGNFDSDSQTDIVFLTEGTQCDDTDGDGIPDWFENLYSGLNPDDPNDSLADFSDSDGLTNLEEYYYGTSPDLADTDGDGLTDETEIDWLGADAATISDDNGIASLLELDLNNVKKVTHVLNRLSYGVNKPLFDDLYPKEGETFLQKYDNWLEQQFDPTTSPGIHGECMRRSEAFGLDYFNKYISCLGSNESPVTSNAPVYTNVPIDNEIKSGVVDITGLKPTPYSGVDTKTYTPAYDIENAVCSNRVFKDLGKSKIEGRNKEYYDLLMDCLFTWQNKCIAEGYDPAQCRRDANRSIRQYDRYKYHDRKAVGIMASYRPMHSSQPLRTVIGDFWDNHFHTDYTAISDAVHGNKSNTLALRYYDTDTYFMNAFGNFYEDLLLQSARSPAMLAFLDAKDNVAKKPNENYAREVMELHTMGEESSDPETSSPVNGYQQGDIYQLARILTGWQLDKKESTGQLILAPGRYRFFSWDTAEHESEYSYSRGAPDGSMGIAHLRSKDEPFINFLLFGQESNNFYGDIPRFYFNEADHDKGDNANCPSLTGETEKTDYCSGNKVFLDFEIGDAPRKTDENTGILHVNLEGEKQGEFALKALAYHPRTAIYICRKLYTKLIGDEGMTTPISYNPNGLMVGNIHSPYVSNPKLPLKYSSDNQTLSACAKTFWEYRNADNQIEMVLRELLAVNGSFMDTQNRKNKAKDPIEYAVSLHKLYEKEASYLHNHMESRVGYILSEVGMDEWIYTRSFPDGLPEVSEELQVFDQARRRLEVTRYLRGSTSRVKKNNKYTLEPSETAAFTLENYYRISGHMENRENVYNYILKSICPDNPSYRGCISIYPKLDKKIAQFFLLYVYGGDYTKRDVQLIYDILNYDRPLNSEGKELCGTRTKFNQTYELGCDSNVEIPNDRGTRINVLVRIMAAISDFSVQ